jgi:ribosomal protein S18 acetylase RimI-like enzyme
MGTRENCPSTNASTAVGLDITYYKRFRMEIRLAGRQFHERPLPKGYQLLPWDDSLLETFAATKFNCFQGELDANVFPSLSTLEGCRQLMTEIITKPGFLPGATWLAAYSPPGGKPLEFCGTIQGLRDKFGLGAIQNIGITPPHRNKGLGTNLIFQCLDGFCRAGIFLAHLEVTSQNVRAIKLYRRLGFITVKTIYKTIADDE